MADTIKVSETRIISLDAGSYYNRVCVNYKIDAKTMAIGTGIVLRNSPEEETFIGKDNSYFVHKEPTNKDNGTLYEGVIADRHWKSFDTVVTKSGHILGLRNIPSSISSTPYYSGAGWSKSGFKTFEDWKQYTDTLSMKINNPLKVEVKVKKEEKWEVKK